VEDLSAVYFKGIRIVFVEKRIKERFNDDILQEIKRRYGIRNGRIRPLDGFESFIYEFERGQGDYILRIGHSLRRSVQLIQGEVDWINYLYSDGASVARAIHSEEGMLVEQVDDGADGQFLAVAFDRAKGQPPGKDDWNDLLFERYGRLIGRMHSLSREYEPANPAWRRIEWDDPGMLDVVRWLPASEAVVIERYHHLKAHLDGLSRDKDGYGLIHQDAHAGNFFVDETGQITLFDFDDCTYSWYMNDIGIILFYAVMGEEDKKAFTRRFMTQFLQGYGQEHTIDSGWLKEIPHFLKLREIDLYAVIHRSFDVSNLDDPWIVKYMDGRKRRIEDDIPYINFDFATFGDDKEIRK
jgi:Ser/Thr protein kinase RdoA (MazF antagonist)